MTWLELKQMDFKWPNSRETFDFSLKLEKDQVLMHGDSGAGKSTLINIILGTTMSKKKNLFVKDLSSPLYKDNSVSFVAQNNLFIDEITVKECLKLTLKERKLDPVYASYLLKNLNLESKENEEIKHLSIGEKQRCSIATALIKKPKLIVCDEATSAQDEENEDKIMNLLFEISRKNNMKIIFSTHHKRLNHLFEEEIFISNRKAIHHVKNTHLETV